MKKEINYYNKKFAKYYDAIANEGYYDYNRDVSRIKSILGNRRRILELGIGTANIAIKLAKTGCEVDGIEPSKPMLKIAQRKIKKQRLNIGLFQQDVRDLNLSKTYQAVFSHGGVPVYIRTKKGLEFESYLNTLKENRQMLRRVYNILEKDGLFLVSIHAEHTELGEFSFGKGLRYFPRIKFKDDLIEKTHCVYRGDKPIVEQTFYQKRFRKRIIDNILKKIGFEILGQKPKIIKPTKKMVTGSFYVMRKP